MNYFEKALKTTNENFIIVLPLVIFYILLELYLSYSAIMADTILESMIALFTIIFMSAVFFAGWFYMIKKAVDLSKQVFILDEEAVKAHLGLIKKFPEGIGKFFLSFVGLPIVATILVILVCYPLFYFGIKFIGAISFTPEQIATLTNATQQSLINFVETLSTEQMQQFGMWNILLMGVSFIFSYFLMFWIPEMIYSNKNPLTSLFTSIRKLFIKPLKSLTLYFMITLINILLSFMMTFTFSITFLYIIMVAISLFVFVYIIVLIFTYYDGEFNEQKN